MPILKFWGNNQWNEAGNVIVYGTIPSNIIAGDTPVKISWDIGSNTENTMKDLGVRIVVPVNGIYRVKCFVRHGYTSTTAWNKDFSAQFYKNNVAVSDVFTIPVGSGIWISIDLTCVAGDEIRVYGLAAANSSSYALIASALMLCVDWQHTLIATEVNPQYMVTITNATSKGTITVSYGENNYTAGDSFYIYEGENIEVIITSNDVHKHTYQINGTTISSTPSTQLTSYTFTPTGYCSVNLTYEMSNGYVCNLLN